VTEINGIPNLKFTQAQGLTLESAGNLLMQTANQYGLPITCTQDQIKSGGLLNKSLQDCLVITHQQHRDTYFKYCLSVRTSGIYSYLEVKYFGSSTNTGAERKKEENKATIGGMLKNALFAKNKDAYVAEYDYYEQLDDIIKETFMN